MAYTSMKKIIENQNIKYKNQAIDAGSYNMWKDTTMNKLDVFLASDRITHLQYEELKEMLLTV